MKTNLFRAAFAVAMVCLAFPAVLIAAESTTALPENVVKTYPAPESERVADVYQVAVDGRPVDVYRAQSEYFEGEYYFAYFDFSGTVQVEVQSAFPMAKTRVLPDRFGFAIDEKDKSVQFKADKPFRVSVEPNGRIKPLLLFGNELEKNVPNPKTPGIVYFGPGVHRPGRIALTDNQTLYLAGGAVVHGAVAATGKNITVCGRGILAGESYPRFQGPTRFPIDFQNCQNAVVADIIVRNPWSWTTVMWNCDTVLIDGLKICGSRMINDDALDLVNTSNAVVRNCFFRTQDDSIAIKGIEKSKRPCENITIENCQFWTDVANIYRIGYECDAAGMRQIVSRGIDALHYSKNYRQPGDYWANAIVWLQPNLDMLMEDCRFDDVVVYSDGSAAILLMAKPMRCHYGEHKTPNPGRLRNCSFKDIRIVGTPGDFGGLIYLKGESPEWNVEGLTFENVRYFDAPITQQSQCVNIGEHVQNVSFK